MQRGMSTKLGGGCSWTRVCEHNEDGCHDPFRFLSCANLEATKRGTRNQPQRVIRAPTAATPRSVWKRALPRKCNVGDHLSHPHTLQEPEEDARASPDVHDPRVRPGPRPCDNGLHVLHRRRWQLDGSLPLILYPDTRITQRCVKPSRYWVHLTD